MFEADLLEFVLFGNLPKRLRHLNKLYSPNPKWQFSGHTFQNENWITFLIQHQKGDIKRGKFNT